jgi:hypothetical protein
VAVHVPRGTIAVTDSEVHPSTASRRAGIEETVTPRPAGDRPRHEPPEIFGFVPGGPGLST